MSCTDTNQCSNAACKNSGDDNLHACCVNNRCVCTSDPCPVDPSGQIGGLTGSVLPIVIVVLAISILVPLLMFVFKKPVSEQ